MAKPHALLDEHCKPRFPRRLSTLIRIALTDMELFLEGGGVLYMYVWADDKFTKEDGTVTCAACMAGSVLLGSYKYETGDMLTALSEASRVADSLNAIRSGLLVDSLIGYYPKQAERFWQMLEDNSTLIELEEAWKKVRVPSLITTKEELAEYKKAVLPLVKRLAKLGY